MYGFAGDDPVSYSDPLGLTCLVRGNCTQSTVGPTDLSTSAVNFGPALGSRCPAISDGCNPLPLAQLGAEHPKVVMAAAIALVGGGAGELGDVLVGAYEAGKTLDEGGTASESALSQAGKAADRAGLTKAGRALAKHCGREVSVFPQASGNPAAINEQGQAALDDILNGVTKTEANKYGGRDYYGAVEEEAPVTMHTETSSDSLSHEFAIPLHGGQ